MNAPQATALIGGSARGKGRSREPPPDQLETLDDVAQNGLVQD